MRILLDMVMNHTSIKHPWFQESHSSQDNPKRDWYIWRDGSGESPPNNWKALPGGSGWSYDEITDQWYYASFLPFQPDLNYRNPAVKEAMFDIVRHWLDKGVDGFRLDIFFSIYKDEAFRDNPFSFKPFPTDFTGGWFQDWKYTVHQNYQSTNVKQQLGDAKSLLNVYKGLLRLRRESAAIREGNIQLIDNPDTEKNLLAYRRISNDEAALVLINFGETSVSFKNQTECKQFLFGIEIDKPNNPEKISLPPYSRVILGN